MHSRRLETEVVLLVFILLIGCARSCTSFRLAIPFCFSPAAVKAHITITSTTTLSLCIVVPPIGTNLI